MAFTGPPASAALELRLAVHALSIRGLVLSSRWVAELLVAIGDHGRETTEARTELKNGTEEQQVVRRCRSQGWYTDDRLVEDRVLLGKTYFDAREYKRCARVLEGVERGPGRFLRLYALFLAGEKRKEEERRETSEWTEPENRELRCLRNELETIQDSGSADAFDLYLLGTVYKRLELDEMAKETLIASVKQMPYLWGAWLELPPLLEEAKEAKMLADEHWIGPFFLGHYYLSKVQNEEARSVYEELEVMYERSMYVQSQLALALYNSREFDDAEEIFERVYEEDPYCLDLVDVYSNILYVKENKKDLSFLAQRCVKIDKYRAQTCLVIGNYYALRKQHQIAVTYFQRALKLDRHYFTAWILIGHEFIEMKNTAAAVDAYRRAVDINPCDFRAWYGLGQTYELLNMPLYTLYYYRKVTNLQPHDARMWCAVGETYKELKRWIDAARAYEQAVECDDQEGVALGQLAALYERLANDAGEENEQERQRYTILAAKYYSENLDLLDQEGKGGAEAAAALKFLTHFAMISGDYEECGRLCERLLDFPGPDKDFAKKMLKELHMKRRGIEPADGTGESEPAWNCSVSLSLSNS